MEDLLKLFKEHSYTVWRAIAPDLMSGGMYDLEEPDAHEILELIFDADRMNPDWACSPVHLKYSVEEYRALLALYHTEDGAGKMMEITATYGF